MSSRKLAATALAATALGTAGCGGSSKTSPATSAAANSTVSTAAPTTTQVAQEIKVRTGKPLSRATWITKGDAICARTNAKLSTTTAKTQQDFARLLPQASGYERAEATELSNLVPPSGKTGDWQQILTSLVKFSEFSSRAGEYAQVKNFQAAIPIAVAGNKAQLEMVTIAKNDGFKVCSLP